MILPKAPFERVLREVLRTFGEFRMSSDVIDLLREGAENWIGAYFAGAYRYTLNAKRVTLMLRDSEAYRDCFEIARPGEALINTGAQHGRVPNPNLPRVRARDVEAEQSSTELEADEADD